jgi:hypothetical protein
MVTLRLIEGGAQDAITAEEFGEVINDANVVERTASAVGYVCRVRGFSVDDNNWLPVARAGSTAGEYGTVHPLPGSVRLEGYRPIRPAIAVATAPEFPQGLWENTHLERDEALQLAGLFVNGYRLVVWGSQAATIASFKQSQFEDVWEEKYTGKGASRSMTYRFAAAVAWRGMQELINLDLADELPELPDLAFKGTPPFPPHIAALINPYSDSQALNFAPIMRRLM